MALFEREDPGVDGVDFPQAAAARQFRGDAEIIDIATLGAGLENPSEAIHRIGQFLALADGHAAGFLAVDVLARLGGEDDAQRVPAIAGGNEHGVDIVAAEDVVHFPGFGAVRVAVVPVGHDPDHFAARYLDVGNHHKLHLGLLEKRLRSSVRARADADAGEHNPVTGSHRPFFPRAAAGIDRRHPQDQRRGFQKVSSGGFHDETVCSGSRPRSAQHLAKLARNLQPAGAHNQISCPVPDYQPVPCPILTCPYCPIINLSLLPDSIPRTIYGLRPSRRSEVFPWPRATITSAVCRT